MKTEESAMKVSETADGKARWHRSQASLPLRQKVRILLELQRQERSLIERHRPLRSWERPWPIEP